MSADQKRLRARFYRQATTGTEPVRNWLLELSKSDRKRVGVDIATVEFGGPIGMPVCRHLRGGIWEVRTDLKGNRIARVLFCVFEGTMILLHGFVKKTRATPHAEIDIALRRKREVLS